MPTYEYRCPKGHEFEVVQRMSEAPVAPCPECGEAAVRLLSAGAGFLFKGEGFYITDYRSDSYREAAKKESAGSTGDGGSSSSGGSEGTGKAEKPKSGAGAASPSSGSKGSGGSDAASD